MSVNAGLYFIGAMGATASNSASQGMAAGNPNSSAWSQVFGFGSVGVSYAGSVADAAARAGTGVEATGLKNIANSLGKAAGALGLYQVAVDIYNHNGDISKMSAGQLLNVAAAVTSMVPGLQVVGFALAGASVAYSIYEAKNGELTIGEVGEYWNTKMDDLAKKFDGRDPEFGKGVLEKLLKLTDWLNGGFDWIGDQFKDFKDWFDGLNRDGNYFLYDPLVLDLDGDGVELIAENDWNGVLFDFNGNGIKTATQWLNGDDGLLVFDRNDNGKIDNGSELFGEDTPIRFITDPVYDGFSALQTIDTHPDFEINAKDDNWQYLKVWRDLNQDGEVQDGELFSL